MGYRDPRRFVIAVTNVNGRKDYYAGSRDGQPTWSNDLIDAFQFRGEMELDAAMILAKTLGAKVYQRGVMVECW